MQYPKKFKEAISHLPSKEKDKLILRLLKHDLILTNRLLFELVSDQSIEEVRNRVKQRVVNDIERYTRNFYSFNYLKSEMGYISGNITEHVRITKDKYGEVELQLFMLNETIKANGSKLEDKTYNEAYKWCVYIVSRAFKIMILLSKLNEDFHLDFKEDIELLGTLIDKHDYLMRTAINHGLNVNWLILFEIPDDIQDIHKNIRLQGYLK